MTGILMSLVGSKSSGSNTLSLVSGSFTTGGKASITYSGYRGDTRIGTLFGSITPTTSATGAPILAIFHNDATFQIAVYLTGNLVGTFSSIKVGATTYNFSNTGTYDSGQNWTLWQTTGTISPTPFSGTVTVVLQ